MTLHSVDVLTDFRATGRYLEFVRSAADANTLSLGFFPSSLYEEFARRGELYVACVQGEFAGHLLFDSVFPRSRILQTYCKEEFRRCGIGRALLAAAIERFTNEDYLSIQARVAADLVVANNFWEKNGFTVQRIERGRGTPPREIRVRIRELNSPQLFRRSSLTSVGNPLGLRANAATELPLYLLDLNVLFDLARKRVRHEQAKDLFRSFNAGHCRLGVSEEVRSELKRTVQAGSTDPMLELIDTLSQFSIPPVARGNALRDQLAAIVFPNQVRDDVLSANDLSDLAHLATAIHHGVSGFVTSEKAHLAAAAAIQAHFGLRVLSPTAFGAGQQTVSPELAIERSSERSLTLRPLSSADDEAVRTLLGGFGIGSSAIAGYWLPAGAGTSMPKKLGAFVDNSLAAYMTWIQTPGEARILVRAAVNERQPEARDLSRLLLRSLIEAIANIGPCLLHLDLPAQQAELREQAQAYGFSTSGNAGGLSKISVGQIVTPLTWRDTSDAISRVAGLRFPRDPPKYSERLLIAVDCPDGDRRHVPLDLLETYLSPSMFVLTGRPAVITPIERRFAEPLLDTSPQASLLPGSAIQLHSERHFIHDKKAIKFVRRGTLMLFYESATGRGTQKGIQAVTAVARVVEAHLKRRDALDLQALERTVLTPEALARLGRSPTKTISAIDNIFQFRHPVPLKRLKALGCGAPNDLITTRPITDQQLQSILSEGFRNV